MILIDLLAAAVRAVVYVFLMLMLLVFAAIGLGFLSSCGTKPDTRHAQAEMYKRTFGSPRPIHKTPPVRHE
jgi:hypothetical protein